MGVDLGDGNRAVAQEGLDIADVHPCVQLGGGESVQEHMWGRTEGDAQLTHPLWDDPPHRLRGKGQSLAR